MNVWIDNGFFEWGSPVPSNLQSGVQQAINSWNTATDGFGNKTCYYFNLVTSNTNVDVRIEKNSSVSGGCGSLSVTSNPFVMELQPAILQNTATQISFLVKHELGHTIGLANASATTCGYASLPPTNPTIMTGWSAGTNCFQIYPNISANDVVRSNVHCNGYTTCNVTSGATSPVQSQSCPQNNSCYIYYPQYFMVQDPDYCTYPSYGCDPQLTLQFMSGGQQCCVGDATPLIIDVEGDGFHMTGVENGVYFDLDSDGLLERLSWTDEASNDAWLVLDRNGNGVVDNGTELFGNYTSQPPSGSPNGFLALAEFDREEDGGDGDGRITERDDVFRSLRLWQDRNHNGISEIDELLPLPDGNVAGISLRYQPMDWLDTYGNHFRYRARALRRGEDDRQPTGRTARWVFDVYLVRERLAAVSE
jgi:hypothetical protein